MAKKFLTPINVTNLSSDPVSANDGDIYYNTSLDNLKLYANGMWTSMSGGGGVTSITGTTNEIDVSASTGAVTLSIPSTIARTNSPTFTGTVTVPTPVNATDAATKAYVDNVVINTQTASYQLVLADAGEVIEMNVASANNLTVPPSGTVNFPIGTSIDIVQYGSGQTTIVAGSGVTLRASGNKLKLTGQYSAATIYKRGTDEWVVMGDLTS